MTIIVDSTIIVIVHSKLIQHYPYKWLFHSWSYIARAKQDYCDAFSPHVFAAPGN